MQGTPEERACRSGPRVANGAAVSSQRVPKSPILRLSTPIGVEQRFKNLLENELQIKVFHDPRKDTETLALHGIVPRGLFDTQVGHWLLRAQCAPGDYQRALDTVLQVWLQAGAPRSAPGCDPMTTMMMQRWHRAPHAWTQRPLPDYVLEYAALDVHDLPALFEAMKQQATTKQFATILKRSCCPRATPSDVAQEFHGYLEASPRIRVSCEDPEVFKSTWQAWKGGEAVTGTARAILNALVSLKRASRIGETLAFAEEPSRRGGVERTSSSTFHQRQVLKEAVNEAQGHADEVSVTAQQPVRLAKGRGRGRGRGRGSGVGAGVNGVGREEDVDELRKLLA